MKHTDSNYYVGLDIGTTKVVAMVAEKDENGKMKVLGYGHSPSSGLRRGVIINIKMVTDAIKAAVEEAQSQSGKPIRKVCVGIAGEHVKSLQQRDYINRDKSEDYISENDIDRLKERVYKLSLNEGECIIHVIPQEFMVDGEPDVNPIGMHGTRLEANFHVVLGQKTAIKNIRECTQKANLEATSVILEPIASSEAVLSEEEKVAGVALIDIGGGTTDLAIFKNGVIQHTAVVPLGGNSITEDIRLGFSIIESYAEQIKVKFGSAWPADNSDNEYITIPGLKGRSSKEITRKNLSKVIYARLEEIISMVYAEIKAYQNGDPKKQLIAGIVLTGGGAQMLHIRQLVEYLTGMDTNIGLPNEHLSGLSPRELSGPIYATSVGLCLHAFKSDRSHSEAINAEPLAENNEAEPINHDPNQIAPKKVSVKESFSGKIVNRFFDKISDFLKNAE